ncbi:hypothetical protein KA005_81775 [bacterium]|nr:hypothetical protein [bacterium]
MRSIWNIISAIAGLLAIGVAVFVFLYGRSAENKQIEVKLISRSVLVDQNVSRSGRPIEILYDGRKISNFAILTCRVANIGGQAIRSADYEKPIGLRFSNTKALLSAEQTASDPEGLGIRAEINQNIVELSKALLNPGDWFNLEIGVVPEVGKVPSVKPDGRIAGVKRIDFQESISEPSKERGFSKWLSTAVVIQGVLVLITMVFQTFVRRKIR